MSTLCATTLTVARFPTCVKPANCSRRGCNSPFSAETPDTRKIERLREGIRIAETHLIIQSDGHMDELRKQQALRRAWLLSSLD